MTYEIIKNIDGTTTLHMNFIDENVDIQGEISIKGGVEDATSYVPFFENDLRCNFADKFPVPEMHEGFEEGEMLE
jgi:hypothetical protein